jgi:hypothetical protein
VLLEIWGRLFWGRRGRRQSWVSYHEDFLNWVEDDVKLKSVERVLKAKNLLSVLEVLGRGF